MNTYYVAGIPYTSELYHHGIKGQKWGIRRFQNPDGTYTQAGLERYGAKNQKQANRLAKYQEKESERHEKYSEKELNRMNRKAEKYTVKGIKARDSGNSRKADRLFRKASEQANHAAQWKRVSDQVLKDIRNMNVSQMKREKLIIGSAAAGSILVTAGSAMVAPQTGWYVGLMLDGKSMVKDRRFSNASTKLAKEDLKRLSKR